MMTTDDKVRTARLSSSTVDLASGMAGGVAQVFAGHPFDTIKVRLQTNQAGQYRSALDCVAKTVRFEGVSGLYKGATSPLLGIGVCNAVLFTANGFFLRQLGAESVATAGSLAGLTMAFVNCPIELLKVRLQVQDPSKPKLYSNIFDCAVKTVQAAGPTGLYRGITATIARDVPSFAAYFAAYESMKHALNDRFGHRQLIPLMAGGVAGIGAWLVCYPQDMIKSRMQSSNQYSTSWDCARSIWRDAGLRGFFRGFAPTMARAFPANAATFAAYEFCKSSLS